MFCVKCGHFSFNNGETCPQCGHRESVLTTGLPDLNKLDALDSGLRLDPSPHDVSSSNAAETLKLSGFEQCPKCGETSLFWNSITKSRECFNPQCKSRSTESEFELRKVGLITEKSDFSDETVYSGQCPQCRNGKLAWNSILALYECSNKKCRRQYTPTELKSMKRRLLHTSLLAVASGAIALGTIAYAYLQLDDFGMYVAAGLTAAAVAAIAWNIFSIRKSRRFRLRAPRPARLGALLAALLLIAATAGAHNVPPLIAQLQSNEPAPSPLSAGLVPVSTPTPTPTPVPTPMPSPTPTPTPTPTPAPTPDPIELAYDELVQMYLDEDMEAPISLDSFRLLAQAYGIDEAIRYVTSGRWDPDSPLEN